MSAAPTEGHVVIRMTGHGRGSVEIDGKPVPNAFRVSFEAAQGEANRVTLEFWAAKVDITGPAEIVAQAVEPMVDP